MDMGKYQIEPLIQPLVEAASEEDAGAQQAASTQMQPLYQDFVAPLIPLSPRLSQLRGAGRDLLQPSALDETKATAGIRTSPMRRVVDGISSPGSFRRTFTGLRLVSFEQRIYVSQDRETALAGPRRMLRLYQVR